VIIKLFNTPKNIKNPTRLKNYILNIFIKERKKPGIINLIFCNDEFLLEINKQYLNHHYYTDVITFDLTPNKKDPIVSDIYISVERIKENAKTYESTIIKELHRVIFHGILHLCGYKDKTDREKEVIRQKENDYLDSYGL
jgi:rRNA maturation RNase YbeY